MGRSVVSLLWISSKNEAKEFEIQGQAASTKRSTNLEHDYFNGSTLKITNSND